MLMLSSICFCLVDSISKLLKSALFSLTPFSEVVSYICNVVTVSYSLPSLLGSPDLLNFFFPQIAYIKVHSSCYNFYGFWQMHSVQQAEYHEE